MTGVLISDAAIPVRIVEHSIDWPTWITAGSSVATTIILGVTGWFIRGQLMGARDELGDAERTRHGSLVTALSERWDEALIVESISAYSEMGEDQLLALVERLYDGPPKPTKWWRERKAQQRWDQDVRLYSLLNAWPNLIETIGVLWVTDVITGDVVYKMWGPGIVDAWTRWEEPVKKIRSLSRLPGTFQYFERLALAMRDDLQRELAAFTSHGDAAGRFPQGDAAERGDMNE